MRIIAVVPVKNDAWFVGNTIEHLRYWADEIIIDDDSSDDGSENLFSSYSSIGKIHHIIRPKGQRFDNPDRRNYMMELARNFDGNNLIFEMHADEIMSAEILKSDVRDRLLNDSYPGAAIMMPWVNLWKSPLYYRNDNSVWSGNKSWFAYRDDRRVKFSGEVYHGPRAPEHFLKNKIDIDYLQVMHYQFVNLPMERSKQALYHIFERNNYPKKNIEHINKIYACAFDERNVTLSKLKDKHYAPWLDKGIPIDRDNYDSEYNWRDIEVLKNFERFGIDKYKDLNIWYIDWELKRQKAIKLKTSNIPMDKIIDPRDFSAKQAHKFLIKYQMYPFWRLGFFKLVFQKIIERVVEGGFLSKIYKSMFSQKKRH